APNSLRRYASSRRGADGTSASGGWSRHSRCWPARASSPYYLGVSTAFVKGKPMTENPMGTDGFEFVEFTAKDAGPLAKVFESLGFRAGGRHRSKNVTQYRQGDINFILNAEPKSPAEAFAAAHGPSICAMAFRVKDAAAAYKRAIELGAKPFA